MASSTQIRVVIDVDLTDENIDDIMFCALQYGISTWCTDIALVGKPLGDFLGDQISKGGKLLLRDKFTGASYVMTKSKFIDGFKRYLKGCHVHIEDQQVDTYDLDARDADCIVQLALFGEVVYS